MGSYGIGFRFDPGAIIEFHFPDKSNPILGDGTVLKVGLALLEADRGVSGHKSVRENSGQQKEHPRQDDIEDS